MVTIMNPQIRVISPRTVGRDIVKLLKVKKKELIKIELKERAKFVMNVVINKQSILFLLFHFMNS